MSDNDPISEALLTLMPSASPQQVERLGQLFPTVNPTQAESAGGDPKLYRVEEAAKQLCISRAHLYALIRSGEVNSVKLGRSRRVSKAEVERLIRGTAV
ncbi:helix-turn-helix domain-containing protein [Mycobacteroides abscessus]|uniref:DNA-binding protein n=1 Tax=Mycobacteroides abscessus TaxID=36809 RepID=A0ABD7HG62_9MYCO|nr:helix-turn-helix domain-containing protein [Mycobacteroides abscessus]NOS02587.1 helix-turn-helix domain-containing protein [Mycobacteroides abscessus]PVA19164.1 DNA-binding protein [Mycobacteroides abscessus]PVA34442.1 DNA-binding protein [Mycobacteroides abscessus]PVA53786.1 DNA-binding protein [Mycobacteroides abscessus]RIQ94706.1 DNA-binding protein [Mycobacteroides abscessus]